MGIRNATIRKHKFLTTESITAFLVKIDFATKNEIAEHIATDEGLPLSIRKSSGIVADYIVKYPRFIQKVSCLSENKSLWSIA
jgi:hypothetical protein|tara:strand:- start:3841 stop:4089 length:249 start_codon:yes stop_codon:yes gene_type:complete